MEKILQPRVLDDSAEPITDLHPVLARIYAARGIKTAAALDYRLASLPSYESLSDIPLACERLYDALRLKQRIVIVGDYDADGATSTALAVSALKQLGAAHVDFIVPNRFDFGYGLSPALVLAAKPMAPDLLITVDNGISSIDGVAQANALGIDVIITDHHLPGDTLPAAKAIINPNKRADAFPVKSLAGVGVIFYLMLALRAFLQAKNWYETCGIAVPNLAEHLDLVALGTVADVVPLEKVNRTLVQQGLLRMRAGKLRPGILALLTVAKRDVSSVLASDLGFAVGPRLNAAGRLDDMSIGIQCLLAKDPEVAMSQALVLDQLNRERRSLEATMQQEAENILSRLNMGSDSATLPAGLCLYQASWHQGVIGILAGRIKERYHRPTAIFAQDNAAVLKGSVRSIPGVHIRDILALIDAAMPGLIIKFGGHAMAAGLSIAADDFARFSQAWQHTLATQVPAAVFSPLLLTDGELQADQITLPLAELLAQAGPWGQAFPEPIFQGIFDCIDQRLVGGKHLKLSLRIPGTTGIIPAIAFNIDVAKWPNYHCQQVHLAYRLAVNEYQAMRSVQLIVEQLSAVRLSAAAIVA